jgi:hypothetical protein
MSGSWERTNDFQEWSGRFQSRWTRSESDVPRANELLRKALYTQTAFRPLTWAEKAAKAEMRILLISGNVIVSDLRQNRQNLEDSYAHLLYLGAISLRRSHRQHIPAHAFRSLSSSWHQKCFTTVSSRSNTLLKTSCCAWLTPNLPLNSNRSW